MWLLPSALWLMAGCSVVDEDLSDCNQNSQYQLEYQLKLVTNMTTEISTKLNTVTETSVANALRAHLKNIFTDFAHDVDLSFYDTDGTYARLHHDTHIMDANQKSYTLTLPMRQYKHLAVANIVDNTMVDLKGDEFSNTSTLSQNHGTKAAQPMEFISSHTTGLFSARKSMEVLEGVDQTFNVRLYMVNSAVTLVLNPNGQSYKDIKVFATGFANSFYINDSTYVFSETPPLVKADEVATGCSLLCYTSVNFPSRDADASTPNATLWRFKVYITKDDDTVTETILDIAEPLQAGDLKIIKGSLDSDCAVRPYDSTVGVSVTLNWNSAGDYEIDM